MDADPLVRQAFASAVVEELRIWPEQSSLRLTLFLPLPAEEIFPYENLRRSLRAAGIQEVELKVRYPEGAATVGEYLALHFEDVCAGLRRELSLDAHWTGTLEYRLEGEDSDRIRLLAAGGLALQALRERRADNHLAGSLAWGCGARPQVQLEEGALALPLAAPLAPAAGPAAVAAAPPASAGPAAAPAKPAPAAVVSPPEGRVFFGRSIAANTVKPIVGMVKADEEGVLEGRIFDLKTSVLKSGLVLAKLSVTDSTDSLLCTLRLPEGKNLPVELKVGARCRLRGKLEINRFEGDELTLRIDHGMLLPSLPRRRDDAQGGKRVELHAHTKMSASDAVTPVEAYIARAIEWGHDAVGISDHGVVHSFPEAHKAAKGKIKLLLGMEAYLVERSDFLDQLREAKEARRSRNDIKIPDYWHCMLYATNDEGRKHLYEMVSHSHTRTFYRKPLIDKALLESKRGGILVGSACERGELYQALQAGASSAELEHVAAFYDYLEVQPPENNAFMVREGKATEEQLRDNVRRIVDLGIKLGKPVVATSDLHFLDPEDALYRSILQAGQGYSDADLQAPLYFHTTGEMLEAMAFLGPELARKVTVDDPQRVAALCANVPPVPAGRFFPEMEGADENVRSKAWQKARELYGEPLPPLVEARLTRELDAVIGNKFGVLYEIARLLVRSSLDKGYSVGSRGSVGSSFAAYCLAITEVNPLPSHERCPACRWVEFREGERLAGVDLPDRPCPSCGHALVRDGYNIPFETFVGFSGDKVPDIDLNFAPEVQGEIQKYAETLFGKGLAFKAGTVSTLAERQSFGYVKKYFEARSLSKRKVEIERLKAGLEGVKLTSGQHPGGVVLVPKGMDINMITPVQYSGDKNEMGGAEKAGEEGLYTTHFDYHAYDEALVKLDILGKDDGSAFRHLQELTQIAETAVPLDDPLALSIFSSGKALGLAKMSREEQDWLGDTGVVAIPEFGTANTRRMLELTQPRNFTELIYISGLSHGTGVWAGNAEKLIQEKTATLQTVISTRDDIMNRLILQGMPAVTAYDITEKIRKGAVAREGFKPEHMQALSDAKLPPWWIESCRKIQYMFPKAHATAYCFTAVRMAWFKVHHPAAFYSAWLTLHADSVQSEVVSGGKNAVLERMRQLKKLSDDRLATAKDEGNLNALVVVLEALLRGISFAKVDLYKSLPRRFLPLGEFELLPPLVSLPGLGDTAADHIDEERRLAPFRSVEELARRCGLNKSVIEKLSASGALAGLPKSDQADLFGAL
ncbi:MAG TPA: PolC-type DNA polymerase III [bacterium]|nr:PolC-type DNA polymerase III [bacterium]